MNKFTLTTTLTFLVMVCLVFLQDITGNVKASIDKEEHYKIDTLYLLDTLKITDTVFIDSLIYDHYIDKWCQDDIILLTKYIKTQHSKPDADNWGVVQCMVNNCRSKNLDFRDYYRIEMVGKGKSGTAKKIESGQRVRNFSFNWNDERDVLIFNRVVLALLDKVPEKHRFPYEVRYFESHPESWNKNFSSGIFQRKNIYKKLIHEYYWHPSTPDSIKVLWQESPETQSFPI